MTPYRAPLALVPLVTQKPLYEYHPWDANNHLRTSDNYSEWQKKDLPLRVSQVKSDVFCPKCAFNTLFLVSNTICSGKRIGLCRKVVCTETREHFHVRCRSCSHTLLMATYDAKEKEGKELEAT